MTTSYQIEAGEANETTTGVEHGMDVTIDLTVDGRHVAGDVTLLPAADGRHEYERWGDLSNWMDARLLRALDGVDGETRREAIGEIEAAAAAKCGRP